MTDRELKKLINEAEGKGKIFLNDGTGLFLRFVAGRPYWTFKYKISESGSTTLKSFGRYPKVSMAAAKQALIKFKADLLEGNTPQAQREVARQQQRDSLTFKQVAADWFARRTTNLTPQYRQQITSRLARHILPDIGATAIRQLDKAAILVPIRKQEETSVSMAHKILGHIREILKFAVSCGIIESNPADGLIDAIAKCPPKQHHPCTTDPVALGHLLRAIDAYQGSVEVTYALKIMPYVFTRSGELRSAMWSEFDFKDALWAIPAEKMKARRPHLVPLARQVAAWFQELRAKQIEHSDYVFPSYGAEGYISPESLRQALFRCGIAKDVQDIHGFRATASTLLREQGHFYYDVIEHQLAHQVGNDVERSYSHASLLDERRRMMQWWADYLDSLKNNDVNGGNND